MVADGEKANCKVAFALIQDIKTDILIADHTYIFEYAKNNGIEVVISPKSNRKLKRNFNDSLYSCRHIVENTFLSFKCWRGIATCYFKTSIAFISYFFIRFINFYLYFFSILNLFTLSKTGSSILSLIFY